MSARLPVRLAVAAFAVSLATLVGAAERVAAPLVADREAESRLLLGHWPDGGWNVQQYDRLVEVHFPDSAFDIVPAPDLARSLAGRLGEITTEVRDGDTFLRLVLSCDCTVSVEADGKSRVLLDIVAPPEVEAVSERATGPAPLKAPLPLPKRLAADGTPAEAEPAAKPSGAGPVDAVEARERLMQQLLRAADAGIVELRPETGEDSAEADADEKASVPSDQPDPSVAMADGEGGPASHDGEQPTSRNALQADDTGMAVNDHISVAAPATDETSPAAGPVRAEPEPRCFGNEVFVLPEMAKTADLGRETGTLRRQLIGEFDRADADVVLDLASLYIAAGFGAEARSVLAEFAAGAETAPVLNEIAMLLEGEALPERASLRKADCLGDQALWRALASAVDGDAEGAVKDEVAAGRALERVPAPLRQMIAGRLGLAAADAGAWDTARRLEAMALRAATTTARTEGTTLLLSARLAEWHGEPDDALALLRLARGADPVSAAEALIRQAETVLRSDKLLGADTSALRTDLGAFAREQRGTEIGAKAFDLEARLYARAASRDDLVDLLSHGVAAGLYPAEDHVALLTRLVDEPALSELARPLALIYSADPNRFAPALEQPRFRAALVRSMAETGLPGLTKPILRPGDLSDPALASALAGAYLTAEEPREALEVAQELPEGHEKHRLVGAALMALGRADQAKGHFAAAANDETVPAEERLAILDKQMQAAIAEGDMAGALDAAERQLAIEPEPVRAERVALMALDAGREAIPAAAVEVLAKAAPARLSGLRLLFESPPEPGEGAEPRAVAAYLEQLDAEMTLIEELLTDG